MIGNVDVEITIVHGTPKFRCGWYQITEMNVLFFSKN